MMEPRKCPATGMACTRQCGEYQPCANHQNEKDRVVEKERRINVDPWYKPPVSDPLFVIMWWYSDKSDFGLIDIAFRTREQAVKICELLQEHSGTKQFLVNQLEIQR